MIHIDILKMYYFSFLNLGKEDLHILHYDKYIYIPYLEKRNNKNIFS